MHFILIENEGIDRARFGEDRRDLRAKLGAFESFRRTPDAPPTDHFSKLGLFLDFDESGKLSFIEIASPGEVEVREVALLGRRLHEVVVELRSRGIDGSEDDFGVQYSSHGFGLYSSTPDAEVEGVAIFAPGYYDDLDM